MGGSGILRHCVFARVFSPSLSRGTLNVHIAICNDAYATEPQRSHMHGKVRDKIALPVQCRRKISIFSRIGCQNFPISISQDFQKLVGEKNDLKRGKIKVSIFYLKNLMYLRYNERRRKWETFMKQHSSNWTSRDCNFVFAYESLIS